MAVSLDHATLDQLRQNHPAWRLLRSDHAALIASFLQRVFVTPNVRVMVQSDLVEALEDELYGLRQRLPGVAFPKAAQDYLNDWAADDKGWLRKFYASDSDEPRFDLTSATEKAILWLESLMARSFVGTESRLLTLFELLKQMDLGSEIDPRTRLAELQRQRDGIDAEIARVTAGDIALLDSTALKDRFQQFMSLSRELLTDFREVEQNFRGLDRRVREHIASWEGAKGALLEEVMGEREAIGDSDQGRSFAAFWDLLLSSQRQEELTVLLDRVLDLPSIADLKPDARTRRVHYDWLEAGGHTQRTVARLSQQLRRFLDDQAWLENRRIMDILRGIEAKALALREHPPTGTVMTIDDTGADIELPMERPLHVPASTPMITDRALQHGDGDMDASALFSQVVIDKAQLARHIRHTLQDRAQVTLRELATLQPLRHGLAELVAYLQLADDSFTASTDDHATDLIEWQATGRDGQDVMRQARLPRVIFVR